MENMLGPQTAYQRLRNYLFPQPREEFGAFFRIAPNLIHKDSLARFTSVLVGEAKDTAVALFSRRRWPLDRRRIILPETIKVYLKRPAAGGCAPIPMIATLAWKAEFVLAKDLPLGEKYRLERFADLFGEIAPTIEERVTEILENLDD
jgi:hypothetical protein